MKRTYIWRGKLKTWINGVCIQSGKTVELDTTDHIFRTPRGGELKLERFEPKPKEKVAKITKKPKKIEKAEEKETVVKNIKLKEVD